MKSMALAFAFMLELVAFAAFSCAGLLIGSKTLVHLCIGAGLFVGLVTFWSLYMAPKGSFKFSPVPYYFSKFLIYYVAALVLFVKMAPSIGTVFVVLIIVDEAVLYRHNIS